MRAQKLTGPSSSPASSSHASNAVPNKVAEVSQDAEKKPQDGKPQPKLVSLYSYTKSS
jgi:hypothetical protein